MRNGCKASRYTNSRAHSTYLKVVRIASSNSKQVFLNDANLIRILTASLNALLASLVRWPPAPKPAYSNASLAPVSSTAWRETVETPDMFSCMRRTRTWACVQRCIISYRTDVVRNGSDNSIGPRWISSLSLISTKYIPLFLWTFRVP